MIYFIETQGLVKIGHSNNVKRRFQHITTGCPTTCSIIGVMSGGKDQESRLHRMFSKHRMRGEWFTLDQEIRDYVRDHAKPYMPPVRTVEDGHPLVAYIKSNRETIDGFAQRVGVSRGHLHRIIGGCSTRTRTIERIVAASDGKISALAFIKPRSAEAVQ